jgi:glucose dehydrogenase
MSRRSRSAARMLGVVGLALGVASIHGADARKTGEWPYYSGDNHSTKYSPLDQIDRDNVARLRVAWRRPQVDPALLASNPELRLANRYTATPIMVNGVLYAPDGLGLVEAIDPETGKTLWAQKPLVPGPDGLQGGGAHWGVAYWSQGSEARIFSTRGQYLFALDAKNGQPRRLTSAGSRTTGPAAGEAAIRPRHRHRSEQRRPSVGGGER